MNNFRGLLSIRRVDKVPNVWMRELYEVKKGVDERDDESVICRLSHIEIMDNNRTTKREYVKESMGSHLVGRPWKRETDSVTDCSKKEMFRCWVTMKGVNLGV